MILTLNNFLRCDRNYALKKLHVWQLPSTSAVVQLSVTVNGYRAASNNGLKMTI